MRKIALTPALLVVFLCSAVLPSLAIASDQWPMYQGNASHTGYIPVTLDPSKFALRWEKKLGTLELNPVTAAGGRVFVSQVGYRNTFSLYALESKSGDISWSRDLGILYCVNPPSYDDGKVYLQITDGGGNAYLRAFNAETGELVFGAKHSAQLERYYSPTVYEGTVYINGGTYGGMYAFDGKSGQQEWFLKLSQYDQWTPAVNESFAVAYLGENFLFPAGLWVADRFTGKIAFSIADPDFEWAGRSMNLAPVLGGLSDAFVINNGRLIGFNLESQEIEWVNSSGYSGQPTVANGIVYAVNAGALSAHDQASGSLSWTWKAPDGKSIQDTIIATNSYLFVRTSSNTYCIGIAEQKEVWSYPVAGHLTLGESTLYIAGSDGTLTAISLGLPDLHVTESVLFDRVAVGGSATRTITISNVGDEPFEVRSIGSSSTAFRVKEPSLPLTIAAHQAVSVQVTFTLTEGGDKKGKLSVTSTDPNEPVISVALTGRSNQAHTVTAAARSGGKISPSGTRSVLDGDCVFYTITPDKQYNISAVLVDGVSIGNPSCYMMKNITRDRKITAKFVQKPYYRIRASANAGGRIIPSGKLSVMEGESISLNISPNDGFKVSDVIVDGVSVGGGNEADEFYTFEKVTANHTIAVVFSAKSKYQISASAGAGGRVDPSGMTEVFEDGFLHVDIIPEDCYSTSDVIVDGISVGGRDYYDFDEVNSNHTISAVFSHKSQNTIDARAGVGGKISPSGLVTVCRDERKTFAITPDKGFTILDVLVDGVSVGASSEYTFNKATSDHAIAAVFKEKPRYVINASAGERGQITPSGQVITHQGESEDFFIVPDRGFRVREILVDGVPTSSTTCYGFSDITSDHSINVTFERDFDYFGVQDGNIRKFLVANASGQSALGKMWITDLSTHYGGPPAYEIRQTKGRWTIAYAEKTSTELEMTSVVDSGESFSFSGRLVTLMNPLKAGQTWTSGVLQHAFHTKEYSYLTITATVSAKTLVQVPAGVFLAFPIQYRLDTTSSALSPSSSWTEYFVPYIGTVLSVDAESTASATKFTTCWGTVQTPPPVVTKVKPSSASPGTQIIIKGFQFGAEQSESKVAVGGVEVGTILSWSDRRIVCLVPEGASSGKVVVDTLLWTSNGVPIRIE